MGGISFDGVDDNISLGDWAALDSQAALTLMVWVKTGSLVQATFPWAKYNGGNADGIALQQVSQKLAVLVPTGAAVSDIRTSNDIITSTAAWYHVAIVFDGGLTGDTDRVKVYLDAVSQALSATTPGVPASTQAAGDAFVIGANSTGGSPWQGVLALFKAWQAALTVAEIEAERWAYGPNRTTNLIGYRPFDDGLSAIDYSGTGAPAPTVTGGTVADGPPVNVGLGAL